MKLPPTIAIILPAHNEAATIAATIESFHQARPEARIVVVNNDSSDRTAEIAGETIGRLECEGMVVDEPRRGKGNALRRAFTEIEADVYVIADADLTYPAARIDDLVRPILEKRADMVVGDRLSGGGYARENTRRFHSFGNRLVRWLINRLFRSRLRDIMSGYRALSRRFVKGYPILVEGFEIETDMTLHALDKRFRILEIPVEYRDRPAGSVSKLNTVSDGARVIFTSMRILRYYRPLFFFGGASVIIGLAALAASVPVFDDWLRERYIYHVPLAILATGLGVVSVVMMAIGLILDSIVHQDKRNFERDLLDR